MCPDISLQHPLTASDDAEMLTRSDAGMSCCGDGDMGMVACEPDTGVLRPDADVLPLLCTEDPHVDTDRSQYTAATSDNLPMTSSLMSPSSPSLVSDPTRLHLVPIVYVNGDGVPTCYEVVRPVPSPSYFASHRRADSSPGLYVNVFLRP